MGPDEYPSREELSLFVRFMFAKFQQQGELIVALTDLLVSKGIIADQAVKQMVLDYTNSPGSAKAVAAYEKIREFATVHKTARQYLDPEKE